MPAKKIIVGIGEALFDVFPDRRALGGAPLNVAVHAHQLGNDGVVVSRVGQDDLGEELIAELARRGMRTDLVQTDPDRPTSTVDVDFSPEGEPSYVINTMVAWEMLNFDFDVEDIAQNAHAICFGTLAQRDAQSRNAIYRCLDTARRAVRLFDVNLRQDYYDRRIIERSLERSTAVKLNQDELRKLSLMLGLGGAEDEAAATLLKRHELRFVALTRGEAGTAVYDPAGKHEVDAVEAPGDAGDPVGAGDATSAALLHGVVRRWDWSRTLTLANTLGAYVASQAGACPQLTDEILQLAE